MATITEPLNIEGEEWRNIKRYPGYMISNFGRVKSIGRIAARFNTLKKIHSPYKVKEKIRKQYVMMKNSRPVACITCFSINGEMHSEYIHTLVMEAFVCERPKNKECCHNDGNPLNNNVNNLRWGTSKENREDSVRHGTLWSKKDSNNRFFVKKYHYG